MFYDVDFVIGGLFGSIKILCLLIGIGFVDIFIEYLNGRLGIKIIWQFGVYFNFIVGECKFGVKVG